MSNSLSWLTQARNDREKARLNLQPGSPRAALWDWLVANPTAQLPMVGAPRADYIYPAIGRYDVKDKSIQWQAAIHQSGKFYVGHGATEQEACDALLAKLEAGDGFPVKEEVL